MKPKKIIQLLKKEALKLPEDTYYAIATFYRPKFDEESGQWKKGEITEHKVNHGRRVKKIYKKWGMPAVNAYFYVKGQLVQQKQSKNEESSIEQPVNSNIDEQPSTETKESREYETGGDTNHG